MADALIAVAVFVVAGLALAALLWIPESGGPSRG
jgi:hypothetical protein